MREVDHRETVRGRYYLVYGTWVPITKDIRRMSTSSYVPRILNRIPISIPWYMIHTNLLVQLCACTCIWVVNYIPILIFLVAPISSSLCTYLFYLRLSKKPQANSTST